MGLRRSILGAAVVAVLMAWGSHAYATALGNTLVGSTDRYGQQAGPISGYRVTNVRYTLDPSQPHMLSAVQFDLDRAAGDVRAKVRSTATTYSSCVNTSSYHWSCPLEDQAAEADELAVIAAG